MHEDYVTWIADLMEPQAQLDAHLDAHREWMATIRRKPFDAELARRGVDAEAVRRAEAAPVVDARHIGLVLTRAERVDLFDALWQAGLTDLRARFVAEFERGDR